MTLPKDWPWWALVVLPLAGVGAALVSQHVYDMQPCSWCVFQRLVFVAVALAALPALVLRQPLVRRIVGAEALLLALAGVAAAVWMHFVAAAGPTCNLTLADRIVGGLGLDGLLPEVFGVWANCNEANVSLLGLPYALWALALFALLVVAAVQGIRRPG